MPKTYLRMKRLRFVAKTSWGQPDTLEVSAQRQFSYLAHFLPHAGRPSRTHSFATTSNSFLVVRHRISQTWATLLQELFCEQGCQCRTGFGEQRHPSDDKHMRRAQQTNTHNEKQNQTDARSHAEHPRTEHKLNTTSRSDPRMNRQPGIERRPSTRNDIKSSKMTCTAKSSTITGYKVERAEPLVPRWICL